MDPGTSRRENSPILMVLATNAGSIKELGAMKVAIGIASVSNY